MRVVQIVPSLVVGGAETLVVQLAQEQLEQGIDVRIVCVRAGGPLEQRMSPELRARMHVVGKRSRFDAKVLTGLVRVLRQLRPEVVHTHIFTSLSWGSVAARLARVPVVVHTQHQAHADDHRYLPFVRRRLARLVDKVVCCSDGVERDVHRNRYAPAHKVMTIENGIPLRGRPTSTLDGDPVRIGTAGRMVEVKGQTHLVAAVRLLKERGVDVRCVLMGDGELRADLEAQAATDDVADRIDFTGRVSDVPDRLAELDLFVLPSLSEGLPMSLLEACAAGLPVLVTSGGGMRVVVDRGAGGWIVTPGSPEELADVVEDYAAMTVEDRRKLGAASRELATGSYSIEACAKRYSALYSELLSRR